MKEKTMHTLKDVLCRELDELGGALGRRDGVSAGDLEALRNITGALKNLYKIERFESGTEETVTRSHDADDGYGRPKREKNSKMRGRLAELMECAEDDECREILRRCMEQFK